MEAAGLQQQKTKPGVKYQPRKSEALPFKPERIWTIRLQEDGIVDVQRYDATVADHIRPLETTES